MKTKRRICVITGSRSDYGIMSNFLKKLQSTKNFELKLIVTCMHLIPKYGNSYKEILKDQIKIHKKITLPLKDDKIYAISKATGIGLIKFTNVLSKLRPDLVLILGDRFESLSFAIASLYLKIPIAHIHGGESTFAQIDDAIRHSITKMSNFHFVSNKFYKNRLIKMGEEPKNIFVIGALGVENIKKLNFYKKKEIEKKLNTKLFKKNFLITIHPETLGKSKLIKNLDIFFNFLKSIKDTKLIFTAPNIDMGNQKIFNKIKKFVKKNSNKSLLVNSLGHKLYLSLARNCNLIIGNSSSGIIEIPSLNIPTINIGNRQTGRIRSNSVIDCNTGLKEFKKAIHKGLSNKFLKQINTFSNPYYKKDSCENLIEILKRLKLEDGTHKKFYDKK